MFRLRASRESLHAVHKSQSKPRWRATWAAGDGVARKSSRSRGSLDGTSEGPYKAFRVAPPRGWRSRRRSGSTAKKPLEATRRDHQQLGLRTTVVRCPLVVVLCRAAVGGSEAAHTH